MDAEVTNYTSICMYITVLTHDYRVLSFWKSTDMVISSDLFGWPPNAHGISQIHKVS